MFARTGVKPMIYSSPNFWQTNMGNTPWFADHGYPLWIAHWGVSAPIVPAGNWSNYFPRPRLMLKLRTYADSSTYTGVAYGSVVHDTSKVTVRLSNGTTLTKLR